MASKSYADQPYALVRRAQRRHREPSRVDEEGLAALTCLEGTRLYS